METENSYGSRDVDIKLGSGDNECNVDENDTEDIDVRSQYGSMNDNILDDIVEVEETDENSSEESSDDDENTTEESENSEAELEPDIKGEESNLNISETIITPESNESSNAIEVIKADPSRTNVALIRKFNKMEVAERPREYISLLGPDSFCKTAQEPWPSDVKLYQPYEVEQILLPDNANCLAVQAFLRMCQLNYQIESRANAEAMSPTGKVPFIKCGAFVVSELEGIVQFVNNRGISLTEKLDTEEKSDMRAYMCLIHNVIEKAELYICWMDNETYNDVTSIRHGSVYPWPLNHIQNWTKRKTVMKNLKVWNWYDKKLEEVFQEVENACQALSDRLDNKEYFFGDRTELDALVFGHVYSMCSSCFHLKEFKNILKKFRPLLKHCERICKLMDKETEYFDDLLLAESGDQ
ncbi:metaxin-2 isoform X2 [Harmonia axyridis]|uniref:metaxin-2 isoform X2 n=1 Tax=Harmonia axyridis TaxID=115357 RepID=UPI001E279924|nr:metaxin-2 isoform X2 [Harmonia axyridis]